MHPKDIGKISMQASMFALSSCGFTLLLPFLDDNLRYDFVIDEGNRIFHRVQAKTANICGQSIKIPTRSTTVKHRKGIASEYGSKNYRGEAEFFSAYCRELNKSYLIPVAECGERSVNLRLAPQKNPNGRPFHMAADYEIRPGINLADLTGKAVPWIQKTGSCSVCQSQTPHKQKTCSKECRMIARTLSVQNQVGRATCPQCEGFRSNTGKVYCSSACFLLAKDTLVYREKGRFAKKLTSTVIGERVA